MLKLLVVEDDPNIRNLLTRRLNREGFQIITASNGVQAVALARAERPALILLDIDIPILDGRKTAQRLRAHPETQGIPIIVLTESQLEERDDQLAAYGCDAYEPKPINFPQMIARVRWLARPDGGERLRAPTPMSMC
ncbi:response regulator [Oscillochloris sp. ZM17-4]|uniref:response regulator n=1 Tax=Oscillochloris sp. ZM17-4 TaxID=2866714 RepID=UPI001C73390F|nr:response regulator [Oscillochloris sp. ZM17-4]MBX0330578.1 response regulator [Oscillochloris sp. ZM17-4]